MTYGTTHDTTARFGAAVDLIISGDENILDRLIPLVGLTEALRLQIDATPEDIGAWLWSDGTDIDARVNAVLSVEVA